MSEHTGASYDTIASKYAASVDTKPWNAFYERPAVVSLLPPLANANVLDVGCGGGILSESMAALGADVTGIDLAGKPLQVARLHALETGARLRYVESSAEAMLEAEPAAYDVVTCLEMLEHVPDPAATVAACAGLARALRVPQGGRVHRPAAHDHHRQSAAARVAPARRSPCPTNVN